MYVCMYVCMYIYIYIYTEREKVGTEKYEWSYSNIQESTTYIPQEYRERERERERERDQSLNTENSTYSLHNVILVFYLTNKQYLQKIIALMCMILRKDDINITIATSVIKQILLFFLLFPN